MEKKIEHDMARSINPGDVYIYIHTYTYSDYTCDVGVWGFKVLGWGLRFSVWGLWCTHDLRCTAKNLGFKACSLGAKL